MTLYESASQVAEAVHVPTSIIYAQFRHESEDGQSPLAREDNNYAGVTDPNGGFMHFDSIEDFTNYMCRFLPKFGVEGIDNPEDYAAQLQSEGYYTADYSEYVGGIRKFMAQAQTEGEDRGDTQEDDVSSTDLDFSVLASNHPGDNYTTALYADENSVGLQPHSIRGLNLIGKHMNDNYGIMTLITGGAERWTHSGGEHSHHTGDKADIVMQGVTPDSEMGQDFISFCHDNGWSCNYENAGTDNAHWDIDFTGHDNRDPQPEGKRKGFTGSFLTEVLEPGYDSQTYGRMTGNHDPDTFGEGFTPLPSPSGTVSTMFTNFWDSVTDSGIAKALEYAWGGIGHSGKWWFEKKDPVTQEDIDYVANALPNDKTAQQFVLLNGRDSEEIRWLVNQQLVEQNRKALVEKWRQENESSIAGVLMNVAGIAGYIVDPMNLVPMGSAVKGVQMLGRLGGAIRNVSKAREIAKIAGQAAYTLAKGNAPMGASTIVNDYLRQTYGGEDVNYAFDAAAAMLAGTVLSAAGLGAGKAFSRLAYGRKGSLTAHVAEVADKAETKAYMDAAGIDTNVIRSETVKEMKKLHDAEYGKQIGSKIYDTLEKNGSVIATTYEKAAALVSRVSGRELPRDAKAFYVPNENYTVLLTDNIKDPARVDALLAHELGVHAGLEKSIGTENFNKLMADVKKYMNKKNHVFNDIRRQYDTQDPEEVFAHAVEDDKLPAGFRNRIGGIINKALGERGSSITLDKDDVTKLLLAQKREADAQHLGVHYNPDGSTAFAGMRFSRDNLLNPKLFEDLYELDPTITKETQAALGTNGIAQGVGKFLEQGIYGLMANSNSNTARALAGRLFMDARGRGLTGLETISGEEQKEAIIKRLSVPYLDYADERLAWMNANKKIDRRSAQLAFDNMAMRYYNAKYAGNKATALMDVPEEVKKAAEYMHQYREQQIDIGKHSADYFGAKTDNLIEKEWEAVDDELWRQIDDHLRVDFQAHFSSFEDAADQLREYIRAAAKYDTIKEVIKRDIHLKNARIKALNEARKEQGLTEMKPLLDEVEPSDADARTWLENRLNDEVESILLRDTDEIAPNMIGRVGELNFLKQRIPMDTSLEMKMNAGTPNEFSFSFDNNLRSFDMDAIVQKNMQRFGGEIAFKNVFHTEKEYQEAMTKIENELSKASRLGDANKSVMNDYHEIERSLKELRGCRPREDILTKGTALLRLGLNTSYVKNGANMGFAQLGEIGGAIAYGGLHNLVGFLPSLSKLALKTRQGKVSAEEAMEAERFLCGAALEAETHTINFQDRAIHDAFTKDADNIGGALVRMSDWIHNLGKVTSTLNMLPKMTESMYRHFRTGYIADAVAYAHGFKTFSSVRNPFTKAKLKASNITPEKFDNIMENLRKYTKVDENGNIIGNDWKAWRENDPQSYFQFYGMTQTHAERAIVSGTKQGNKNLVKANSWMARVLLQFKDYNLRAISGQTMRALTARDLDDAIALGMSMATNTAAFMLRAGFKGSLMYAAGNATGANDYLKQQFDEGQLLRVAALRSAMASPLSFVNDVGEAWTGAPTIRTTVDRSTRAPKDQDAKDKFGNAVAQLPAIQELLAPVTAGIGAAGFMSGEGTQRDVRRLYNVLPIPRFIPFMTYIDSLIKNSGVPEKRPKTQ